MKNLYILFLLIPLLYNSNNRNNHDSYIIIKTTDSLNWIQSFKDFRNAISLNNRNTVKSFIEFPFINDNNDIWQVLYEGNQKKLDSISEKVQAFKEEDFDNYYFKLFSKKFSNCIAKLRLDELKKNGETETIKLRDGNLTTYSMYASIDTIQNTLTLALGFQTIDKDKNGKIEGHEEYGTLYIF